MTKAERKQLERFVGTGPACAVNLAAYLKSKAPKRKPKSLYRKAKEEKAALKKGARADVRAACVERAGGTCECCGIAAAIRPMWPLEMDHFYGRAFSESVETCWMLCGPCHRCKTENLPDRACWDDAFARHCARHGYPLPRKRLVKNVARLPSLSEPHDRMERSVETAGGRSPSVEAPAAPKGNSP